MSARPRSSTGWVPIVWCTFGCAFSACAPHSPEGWQVISGDIRNDARLPSAGAEEPIIVIQMEHIDVVERIDAMLDVEEIGVFCFGPNDLAGSIGKLGQLDDEEVVAALDAISKKVVDRGRVLGTSIGYSPENYQRWVDRGATWINLDVDWDQLFRDSRRVLGEVKRS